ncbi:MAG: competence/damage-inducible protein A [Alphaproteobacteria bacterium]|nr:competence/damage-inducible protein A [Alphaproteobacteria bacterium]
MTRTAAICIIGNEVLSGRTQDLNGQFLAKQLGDSGIETKQIRVIPDNQATIVATVNELRQNHDYLLTTGGIGPTHDDITTEAIAKAFDRSVILHQQAFAALEEFYRAREIPFTAARQKMAQVPQDAVLIPNPVSIAPGYQVENVFVLAGVPKIVERMYFELLPRLETSAPLQTAAVQSSLPEGTIADALAQIADEHPKVDIGSYPSFLPGRTGPSIVVRSKSTTAIASAVKAIEQAIIALGGTVVPETQS